MKAMIAAAVGALALGGIVVAGARSTAPETKASDATATSSVNGPLTVNCGEGRQAVFQTLANGIKQVECVPALPVTADGMSLTQPAGTLAYPTPNAYAPAANAPVAAPAPVVQERIVTRDRPAQTSSVRRTSSSPTVTRTSSNTTTTRRSGRSWKKSAAIIGGGAAGGAGLGAILGGGNGAKKGAVVGGVAGLVYDIATRNKDSH